MKVRGGYWLVFLFCSFAPWPETYNVEIYAYVLMTNHFHFYLCTPEANLTRFMQSLLTSYTMYRNKTEGTGGHIFQGRYKPVIVEHDKYAAELSRYIHLNPSREIFITYSRFQCKHI